MPTIWYVGGQLGGDTEFHDDYPGPTIRVPVMAWAPLPGPGPDYNRPVAVVEEDTYRHFGESQQGALVYRWVRPNVEGLLARIRELEDELAVLKAPPPPPRKGLMRFER